MAWLRLALASAGAVALLAGAAWADEPTETEQLNNDINAGDAQPRAQGVLVAPIPVVDPQLGEGAVVSLGYFYSPVQGGRPWVSGGAGLYTSNKDWALGAAQQADLLNGKLRLTGFVGYGVFQLDFFGTGAAAGAAGRSIKLDEKGLAVLFNGLYDVGGPLYVGLRYQYLDLNTSVAFTPPPNFPNVPAIELDTVDSSLGPSFEYDTRNSQFMPSRGLFVNGTWLFTSPGIGATFDYNKVQIAANGYVPLDPKTVLALRASVCNTSHGAPFYDLCLFGSQHDLRGYEGGRYRDHDMLVGQIELRRHLFWRVGAVAFGGVGSVGPTFGDLFSAKALPAAGVGLRLQPLKKIPVNLSVDYAWGRDSQGLYLYLGESF